MKVLKSHLIFIPSTLFIFVLSGCQTDNLPQTKTISSGQNQPQNTLSLVANGEDFIRQGFVSKDGWQIDFNHVYVTLNQVKAYQMNPPLNLESQPKLPDAKQSITLLDKPITVDLTQKNENASAIKVTEVSAPVGTYNAITWSLVNDAQGDGSIILDGIATKKNQTINFNLQLSLELHYLCGEFVGDERKGIISATQGAELETTFHFDHLFGNAKTSADDELNVNAIGFNPLANIAS